MRAVILAEQEFYLQSLDDEAASLLKEHKIQTCNSNVVDLYTSNPKQETQKHRLITTTLPI